MNDYLLDGLHLVIPGSGHEAEYCRVMDKWEAVGEKIQPPSMRRYSSKLKANVSFAKWLEWCEDDRATGSCLVTQAPYTMHFLMNSVNEILGGIDISSVNTPRGHLHAGIVPWCRGKGYGTAMLHLALLRCNEMGLQRVQIVPRKDNIGAIQTILRNGGIFMGDFYDDDVLCSRYEIDTLIHDGMTI